jgi:subtilisin family serine protease
MLVVARSAGAVDLAALSAAGADVVARHGRLVEVRVPADRVGAVRALAWTEQVGLAPRALPSALSEGVRVTNASTVHDLNVTGNGVTVGVLDNGFDRSHPNVSDQLVAARSFGTTFDTGSAHGTAVAEALAETAPDAGIYLAAFEGATGYVEAVDWLDRQGVDVIVMAYGWPYQPADGTGWASETAADAVANGSVWVNSAGNYGRKHWAGEFSNPDRNGSNADRFHNFYYGPDGNDELNALGDPDSLGRSGDDLRTLEAGDRIDLLLEWDHWPSDYESVDAWRETSPDFALHLYNSSGLVESVDRSHGTYDQPLETLSFVVEADDTYSVAITNVSADAEGTDLELYTFETSRPQYRDPAGSLLSPADRAEVVTVGAAYHETNELEAYSSRGPTDDGRRGVDLLGPDGTSSDVYADGFYGTSAAAPHVGGVAALVRAANGSLSPRTVEDRLTSTARDVEAGPGTPGPDPATGYGHVDARAAVRPDLSVAGRLVDGSGDPLADHDVTLVPVANGATVSGRTGTDGRFDLRRPDARDAVDLVTAGIGGGSTTATPGDGVPDVYAVTRVDEPGERRLGTRQLPAAAPGTVRVVNDTGAPVADASVLLTHEGDGGATATVALETNASGVAVRPATGRARIDAVGDLSIRATSPAGGTATRRPTVAGPGSGGGDEWNATVTVPSAARWRVDRLDAPATVERGDPATVSARVTHVEGAATNETTVGLFVDWDGDGRLSSDERAAARSVTVAPGDNLTVPFDFDTNRSAGDYRVGIAVGAPTPGSNATATRNVTIEPMGVLLNVTNVTAPGQAVVGESVPVTATLRNVGDLPADGEAVELRVDVDGDGAVEATDLERAAVGRVSADPGEDVSVTLALNTTGFVERTYRIGVFSGTDSAGEAIDVRAPARYEPTLEDVESTTRGQPLRVPFRVTNEGGSANSRVTVQLRLDRNGDGRLEPSETVNGTRVDLAPNATRNLTLSTATGDLAPGEYVVGIIAPGGVAKTRTRIRPAPAELIVESLEAPARVPADGSASFRVQVRNVGGLAGNETTVLLRLDRDRDGRTGLDETVDGTTVRLGRGETTTVGLSTDVRGLAGHYYEFRVVTSNDSRRVSLPVGDVTAFENGLPGTAVSRPPTNVDGDSKLEDVDGDGKLTFFDVIELLFADWAAINADYDGRAALDFDGNGHVGFLDVVTLLFEL